MLERGLFTGQMLLGITFTRNAMGIGPLQALIKIAAAAAADAIWIGSKNTVSKGSKTRICRQSTTTAVPMNMT